jgi:hypothetical protein
LPDQKQVAAGLGLLAELGHPGTVAGADPRRDKDSVCRESEVCPARQPALSTDATEFSPTCTGDELQKL